jgi:hypothetical protein
VDAVRADQQIRLGCRPSAKCSRTPSWPASYRTSSEPKTSLSSRPAASTSRKVWRLTEVDKVAGAYGSAAEPAPLCSLSTRSRSLITVARVLVSPQVAWNTAQDLGGRHCSPARPARASTCSR